jgi:hypothetical protein
MLGSYKRSMTSRVSKRKLTHFLISPMRATWFAYHIIFYKTILVMLLVNSKNYTGVKRYNRTSSLGSPLLFTGNLKCFFRGHETDVEGYYHKSLTNKMQYRGFSNYV